MWKIIWDITVATLDRLWHYEGHEEPWNDLSSGKYDRNEERFYTLHGYTKISTMED